MTIIPSDCHPLLNLYETQEAITIVKKTFEGFLSKALYLKRVSAPLFVAGLRKGHHQGDAHLIHTQGHYAAYRDRHLRHLWPASMEICQAAPQTDARELTFVTTQELEDACPSLSARERENVITQQFGTVGILQIGEVQSSLRDPKTLHPCKQADIILL